MIDVVNCRCGDTHDRAQFAQCPAEGHDLWESDVPARSVSAATATPAPNVDGSEWLTMRVGDQSTVIEADTVVALGRFEHYPLAGLFEPYPNVSRIHGVLRYDGNSIFVTDSGSTNGTFIDDERIVPHVEHELRPGSSLRLAADVQIRIASGD